ncbi:MAG: hypothetical protein IT429_11020 [Gemmataceae bacterium]|nr:hypothetical protein [Gemmataceae bacterium]
MTSILPPARRSSFAFVLLVYLSGCGAGPDLNRAEAAVKTCMDKWKEGGTPQQLADKTIEITDPDWKAGYRLLDYQLKAVSAQPQQGPRVIVTLNLQSRAGKKMKKEVAYEVLIKDKVQIGRDAFHVGS